MPDLSSDEMPLVGLSARLRAQSFVLKPKGRAVRLLLLNDAGRLS